MGARDEGLGIRVAVEGGAGFGDGVGEKLELGGYEGSIVGVTGPGGDVDDVEGLVEEGEEV